MTGLLPRESRHVTGRTWRRTFRRLTAACLTAGLLAAPGPGGALAVTYILYYHTFGDWAVVCYRGMVDGRRSCFIDAPPIQFNTDPYTSQIRIEPDGKSIELTVSARSGTRTGTKVRLEVDGRTVEEGESDQIDHLIVTGAAAAGLVEAFQKGRILVVELPDLTRKQSISLKDFDSAYAAFQENLDRYEVPVGAAAPSGAADQAPAVGPSSPARPGN